MTEAIATEETKTKDHQQEEELKAAAANNDGYREEAADCELLPKSAATDSQESDFGSLLGKRNNSNHIERDFLSADEQTLVKKDVSIIQPGFPAKKRSMKKDAVIINET